MAAAEMAAAICLAISPPVFQVFGRAMSLRIWHCAFGPILFPNQKLPEILLRPAPALAGERHPRLGAPSSSADKTAKGAAAPAAAARHNAGGSINEKTVCQQGKTRGNYKAISHPLLSL
jgi:hypothetical protein